MRRKQTYLIHKAFARCRVLAARYSSRHEMFLCETTDPGTKVTTQRHLLAKEEYWNEDPEQITFVFEAFMRDSERIERALALKAKKQAEIADAEYKASWSPESEPDSDHGRPPEIRRREAELDLTDFDDELNFDRDSLLMP
jgi:hypothetical protein